MGHSGSLERNRLNRGRTIPLCQILVAFAALVASAIPIIGQQLDTHVAEVDHQPKEQIVTEPDGRRVVLVRWAIGSRDSVTTLRIPLVYVPIWGDERLPDPFAATIVAEAMLWT